jgi:hypothetical protein
LDEDGLVDIFTLKIRVPLASEPVQHVGLMLFYNYQLRGIHTTKYNGLQMRHGNDENDIIDLLGSKL